MRELTEKKCVNQGYCEKLNYYYNIGGRICHNVNDNQSE